MIAVGIIFFSTFLGLAARGPNDPHEMFLLFFWFLLVCLGIVFLFSIFSWLGRILARDENLQKCVRWIFLLTLVFWVIVANYVGAVRALSEILKDEGPFAPQVLRIENGGEVYEERDSFLYSLYTGFLTIFSTETEITSEAVSASENESNEEQMSSSPSPQVPEVFF